MKYDVYSRFGLISKNIVRNRFSNIGIFKIRKLTKDLRPDPNRESRILVHPYLLAKERSALYKDANTSVDRSLFFDFLDRS